MKRHRRHKRLPGALPIAATVAAGLTVLTLIQGPIDLARPAAPLLNASPGLVAGPLTLTIESPAPHGAIYYTTNGGPPTTEATHYGGPVGIAETTVIRAASVRPWIADSRVSTASYIFPAQVALQGQRPAGLPESWRGHFLEAPPGAPVEADYAMDPRAVTDSTAFPGELEVALRALPAVSLVMEPADLFDAERGIYVNATEEGASWERPVSVEYFDVDGHRAFQADAGVRINGLSSRRLARNPKQGFRILFRRDYGTGALRAELFGRHAQIGHEALVLRNLTQDSWATRGEFGLSPAHYIRDQFSRETQAAMGHPAIQGTFVHLFLNGLYWGIYSLCERVDGSFLSERFGGSPLQFDIIKGMLAQAGTRDAWDQVDHLSRAINDPNSYKAIENLVDLDNFIDYVLLNQFTDNLDWHAANALLVRKREADGRFIFLIYDAEVTFGSQRSNMNFLDLGQIVRETPFFSPLHLFHRLQGHPEFIMRVADRIQRHYFNGGALGVEAARHRWRHIADRLDPAMVAEAARWGDSNIDGITRTREGHWRPAIMQIADEYFIERTALLLKHYRTEGFIPSVGAPEYALTNATGPVTLGPTGATIYYTLDGSDPRLPGGAVNEASASLYVDSLSIPASATLKARARAGDTWSAMLEIRPTASMSRRAHS